MMRQSSHSSSHSNPAASPRTGSRLRLFKPKRPPGPSHAGVGSGGSASRDEPGPPGPSDKVYEPSHSDKIPSSPYFQLPDLERPRSCNGLPSQDSFVGAAHDTEYLSLRENLRRVRKAPAGADSKKVDAAWEIYKKVRDGSLQLCKSLLHKSQSNGRSALLESNIGPLDTRSSCSGSITERDLPFHVNEQWLSAINEYKSLQEQMLENLRTSLLSTYKAYEPQASEERLEAFLADKVLRENLITKWRDESVHRMKSEKLLFWEQYRIRSVNYHKLKLDLYEVQKLSGEAENGKAPDMATREYVIAMNGDTILEFANTTSEIHPVLRFRVSSHFLAEASDYFAQFLSAQKPKQSAPFDMISQLPPASHRQVCKDGMTVNVYRMPQIELNEHDALTTLLHAAHMHHLKVPKQIEFPAFVSIADVCLRYRCTSPLEMHVEHEWLPQWIHLVGDDSFDGFLLISYAFGLRRIFTRISKTAILQAVDEEQIRSKTLWPQALRDKIVATRAAKIAQIYSCCTNAMVEYFRAPSTTVDRRSRFGSLQLTSLPRCPRGSHLCDATNLGWLMLVYNELQVLPSIMKDSIVIDLSELAQRSLKELVDCLRLMPSAPQVHSGVCDHAAAFRSDINDIYNSVTGLTLRDVSGRDGWALSKHTGPTESRYDHLARDVAELDGSLFIEFHKESAQVLAMSNEDINLQILSNIEDMEDLSAAAMIDKSFYCSYKRNEALLLKNIMREQRRRTLSQASANFANFGGATWPFTNGRPERSMSIPSSSDDGVHEAAKEPKSPADEARDCLPPSQPSMAAHTSRTDIRNTSPSISPTDLTTEEMEKILWPSDAYKEDIIREKTCPFEGVGRNEKCLLGDFAHVEDKSRMGVVRRREASEGGEG